MSLLALFFFDFGFVDGAVGAGAELLVADFVLV